MPLTKSPTTKIRREAMIRIPLSSMRYVSNDTKKKKIVFEVSTKELTRVNKSTTLNEMISEAKLEFAMGKTKGFTDTKKLLAHLNA